MRMRRPCCLSFAPPPGILLTPTKPNANPKAKVRSLPIQAAALNARIVHVASDVPWPAQTPLAAQLP